MAIINKTGITNGGTIQAEHITRVIDALSGVSTDTLILSGSMTGSLIGTLSGTASFATTASYALNATSGGGSEYMTIRLSHAKQTGTIDSTTSYFGAGTHTVKDGINRAGAILPFDCQVISASFYTSTDVQGGPTITYRLYADVTGTPTVLANGPTLDLSSFMDASAQAIGSGTITAGQYVNVRMTENGEDPAVEFTSTVDLLIKKV